MAEYSVHLIPVWYAVFFWFCIKWGPKDQSCVLLSDSQATNILLMSALALSTRISDTEDGRACHELCVVETIYVFKFTYHFSCKLREIVWLQNTGQGAPNSRDITSSWNAAS